MPKSPDIHQRTRALSCAQASSPEIKAFCSDGTLKEPKHFFDFYQHIDGNKTCPRLITAQKRAGGFLFLNPDDSFKLQFCSGLGSTDPKSKTFRLGDLQFKVEGRAVSPELLFLIKEAFRTLSRTQLDRFVNGMNGETPLGIFYGNAEEVAAFYKRKGFGEVPVNLHKAEKTHTNLSFYDPVNNYLVLHQPSFENGYAGSLSRLKVTLHEISHAVDDFLHPDSNSSKKYLSQTLYADNADALMQSCKHFATNPEQCYSVKESFAEIFSSFLFIRAYSPFPPQKSRNPILEAIRTLERSE